MQKLRCSWKTAYGCLGVLAVLLIFRAFFGVDYTDESFYFALAKRFAMGDQILVDEWFPTQLIGVLLLPFYRLYVGLCGSQEGIILAARLCYVGFSVLVAGYMLAVFRKESRSCGYSFLAAAMCCIYVRAGIGTFSYYSLGLETFLLFLLLWTDGKHAKRPEILWVLAGVNFSISVICMPYLVLVFGVLVVVYLWRRKRVWPEKDGICFCLGIALISAFFFVGIGPDLIKGFQNIPKILMDPLHQGTVWEKLTDMMSYLCFTYLKYTWPLYGVTFVTGIAVWRKKISQQKWIFFYKGIVYLEFFVQAVYVRNFFEGGIIVAVLLLAVQIWLASTPSPKEHSMERLFLSAGLGFSVVWILGSNVGIRVLNMGVLLADIWALYVLLEDSKKGEKIFCYLRDGVIILLFGVLILNRFLDVYRDSAIWRLDTQVSRGSMKYLFTTAHRAEEYEQTIQELERYMTKEDRLAVPGLHPWIYLEAPARCGAYSVWKVDFTDERNWSYYKKYTENIPSIVLVLKDGYGRYDAWRYTSHGSNPEGSLSVPAEGYLEELIQMKQGEQITGSTGIFYKITR